MLWVPSWHPGPLPLLLLLLWEARPTLSSDSNRAASDLVHHSVLRTLAGQEQGTRCGSTSNRYLRPREKRPSLSEAQRGKAASQAAVGSPWLPGGLSGDRISAQTRDSKASEGRPAGRTGRWGLAPGQNVF